jgi:hypothetical protein
MAIVVALFVMIFFVGFAAGYGLRAYKSHKRHLHRWRGAVHHH